MSVFEEKLIAAPQFLPLSSNSLDNGISVHQLDGASQDVQRIELVFPAGKAMVDNPLVGSIFSKLILSGSKKISAQVLNQQLDQWGVFAETEIGQTETILRFYALNRVLDKLIPFIAEWIPQLAFPQDEFEREKTKHFQKFKVNLEKVNVLAARGFRKNLYSKHPYGRLVEEEDFSQVQLEDMSRFFSAFAWVQGMQIYCAGKTNEKTLQLLNAHLGQWPLTKERVDLKIPQPSYPKGERIRVEKNGALQSSIIVGGILPSIKHPDYPALKLSSMALGGYFGSRLMKNIREDKGYTYGINCSIKSQEEWSVLSISTEVGKEHAEDTLKEIFNEFNRWLEAGFEPGELQKVRNYMLGSLLTISDGVLNQMDLYRTLIRKGLPLNYYVNYIEQIKSFNEAELLEVSRKHWSPSQWLQVVAG